MTGNPTNNDLKDEIWRAAEEQGRSRNNDPFLIAQRNPQGGWDILPDHISNLMDAETKGGKRKVNGIELYIVSANDQHGLVKIGHNGKLVALP